MSNRREGDRARHEMPARERNAREVGQHLQLLGKDQGFSGNLDLCGWRILDEGCSWPPVGAQWSPSKSICRGLAYYTAQEHRGCSPGSPNNKHTAPQRPRREMDTGKLNYNQRLCLPALKDSFSQRLGWDGLTGTQVGVCGGSRGEQGTRLKGREYVRSPSPSLANSAIACGPDIRSLWLPFSSFLSIFLPPWLHRGKDSIGRSLNEWPLPGPGEYIRG